MIRWVEQNVTFLRRRISPKYSKMIVTALTAFVLINAALYLMSQFIMFPETTTTTTEETTVMTTTTTSEETTTEKTFQLGCFFDKTNVTLADGSLRPLSSLKTGDDVLVYSSTGKLSKSRVLTIFHHHRPSIRLLELYTENSAEPLRLTPSHSILTKKHTNKQAHYHYTFASNVAINDLVLSSGLSPLRVTDIKEILLFDQTISTPLTFEGNIIANNLVASCYATFRHSLMHTFALPLRYWYQIEAVSHLNYLIVYLIDFYSKISF